MQKILATPPPVKGRNHTEVQTGLYLEELYDVIETDTVCCQTDDFLDRPPTPLFVPAKTGVDVATEILSGDVSLAWFYRSFSFELSNAFQF